jgi:hypothetical protein
LAASLPGRRLFTLCLGVSGSNNDDMYVQLGTASGIETSGYLGSASNALAAVVATNSPSTTDFDINKFQTVDVLHGTMVLTLADTSNTWAQMHSTSDSNGNRTFWGAGQKPLSEELTQIKFGVISGALAAGSVNIMYS